MEATILGHSAKIVVGDEVLGGIAPLDLGATEITGQAHHIYVAPWLRKQLSWTLPSNAKLARRRRHIEKLQAQRIGRR